MIPPKHTSLLIADGRRAKQWELGLKKRGFAGKRVPTMGSDSEKGDYWLVVPDREVAFAQGFVTKVIAGKESLPSVAPVHGPLLWGASIIVLVVVAMMIAAILIS